MPEGYVEVSLAAGVRHADGGEPGAAYPLWQPDLAGLVSATYSPPPRLLFILPGAVAYRIGPHGAV